MTQQICFAIVDHYVQFQFGLLSHSLTDLGEYHLTWHLLLLGELHLDLVLLVDQQVQQFGIFCHSLTNLGAYQMNFCLLFLGELEQVQAEQVLEFSGRI